ncbi:hypothetical protein [Diaphorobacter aerolatus]|uniref:Uncharacterized protein n=1 Tax=Diaphorobacter aerolatus TaxID=1288495 RepID=A0A7H0GP13_9BURK|nr:hypothetical protein [Diaphorobacter aerolatus]QNP50029.1 hypothetical protein H9K75_09370 [Diaphorobacter aerolatus]
MKTFFIRSIRQSRDRIATAMADAGATRAASNVASHEPSQAPLEQQVMALDTLTTWPTHRIRSFLSMQSRRVR